MHLERRIYAFHQLGDQIKAMTTSEFSSLVVAVANQNPWFTEENLKLALQGVSMHLNKTDLTKWASSYQLATNVPKTVGLAMAGNIPLVGFHDLLCVLLSGHHAKIKLSSSDSILLPYLIKKLIDLEPEFDASIRFDERLNLVDAVIATGSDNTARYFEYYFRNIPHIIRKNRSSCALLTGNETPSELTELGTDIFSYFGLGCRNISKLYLPKGYSVPTLFPTWEAFGQIIHHHKYANNYDYQKSILLVNKVPFLDNGFVLVKEDEGFVSPISILFYEYYETKEGLNQKLSIHRDKIQCIVSSQGWYQGSENFGKAQLPGLADYADNIDTLRFLEKL